MKTELIIVTDRSGSMQSIRADCIGGFEKFIADQKKVEGECRVTSLMFDHAIEYDYVARPLSEVSTLKLEPRGSTALFDALGSVLNDQGARITKEKWAELVIVVVITDGGENASREYRQPQIKTMIEHAEKNGWNFIFLAANQDGFANAASYGMSNVQGKTFSANSAGTVSAYHSASVDTVQLRSGLAPKNEPTL